MCPLHSVCVNGWCQCRDGYQLVDSFCCELFSFTSCNIYSDSLVMYRIKLFEIRLKPDVAGYPPEYLARLLKGLDFNLHTHPVPT